MTAQCQFLHVSESKIIAQIKKRVIKVESKGNNLDISYNSSTLVFTWYYEALDRASEETVLSENRGATVVGEVSSSALMVCFLDTKLDGYCKEHSL